MDKKIYVSGMHSGQNPSSGVGIAKSLRAAFPDIKIIGVDHWQGSSGLHHQCIDDILLIPQWGQIDSARHRDFLNKTLAEGNIWISALDVEVYWLAQNFGAHPSLFALCDVPICGHCSHLTASIHSGVYALQSIFEVSINYRANLLKVLVNWMLVQ